MMTHHRNRILASTLLLLLPLLGCFFPPADPSRPFRDGDEIRLALGASLELRGDVDGTFEIGSAGVVDVVSQSERELVLRGLAPGEAELTFASSDGEHVEIARLVVAPAASIELDPIQPFLAGTIASAGVRLRDAVGLPLAGSGLSRVVDAPVGTTLSAQSTSDVLTLAPPAAGTYRAAVALDDTVAEREFEVVSIDDTDIAIEAPDVDGLSDRWFTLTVTHEGRTLPTFQPEITWTLDGSEVGWGAPDAAFPGELCVSVLGRTECAWIE